MSGIQDRRSGVRVRLLKKDGSPASNMPVKFTQTNHEFLFGCNAFEFIPLVADKEPSHQELLKVRTDKWLDLFNFGTLPFYWGQFEPEEGRPQTGLMLEVARLLKSHNVTLKGHPLCWQTVCAPWLLKYDNEAIMEKQLDRIHREVRDFKGLVDAWDVINEVVIMEDYDRYDNAATRLCKEKGRIGLAREVFSAAHQESPDAVLLINDFNLSVAYDILIEGILAAGTPVSAIGIQSHQHQGFWGKEKLEAVLARYEKFGLPIHFTENTIVSGPLVPPHIQDLNDFHYDDNASTPELEELQKNQLELFYRTIFEEHPLVKAVTNWDFTDGAWLNAPGGLLRRDGSVKPAYNMLRRLIWDEWCSSGSVKTNQAGVAVIEGFKGSYELCCGAEGESQKITLVLSDSEDDEVVVRL